MYVRKDRYRYPSHALRFSLKSPTEIRDEFIKRINAQALEENERSLTSGTSDKWIIGKRTRNVGSVHSDIWEGTALELAESKFIAVHPATGWWKERHYLNSWDKQSRIFAHIHCRTWHPLDSQTDILGISFFIRA